MTNSKRTIAISERPMLDTVAAAAVVLLHALLLEKWFDPWSALSGSDTQVIFQTGAGVAAVISGLASVGLAAGGVGERGKSMRKLYGSELRRNWRALLLATAAAPLCAIAAQVAMGNGKDWAPYLFEFAMLWTGLRIARLTWLIDALMRVEELDANEPERPGRRAVSADFKNRMSGAA